MSGDRTAVLVTEDQNSYGVLAAVRALRQAGYVPWLAVASDLSYGVRSRAVAGSVRVASPAQNRERYVRELADSAHRLSASVVLPGTELGLVALAGAEEAFPNGVALGTAPPSIVEHATDKIALSALARDVGLDAPATVTLTRADLQGGAEALQYPVVVKPVRTKTRTTEGRLRHGRVQRVDTPEELRPALDRLPGERWLVQPYLSGSLYAVSGVAWNGRLVAVSHQVADRIYPPDCGISAYAVTVRRDRDLELAVGRLLEVLGWSGLFEAQFMRTERRMCLIDVNLRVYGSLALAVAAGLNLPAIWTDLLLGRRPSVGTYRTGVRYRAEEKDVPAILTGLVRGPRRSAAKGLLPRRRTVHAVFSLRDPLPLLTSLAKLKLVRRAEALSHT